MKNNEILDILDNYFPDSRCELLYTKDYELLLSVMLSAQTTDKRVNSVTVPLFKEYDTLEKLDSLSIEEIEEVIKTIGMYKTKARYFKEVVSKVIELGGRVPSDREVLMSIPGVGRKTSSVVLAVLFNVPCIAVDTHVNRVSKRLGLASENDSTDIIEKKLMKFFNKKDWNKVHYDFVLFGRYRCMASRPQCKMQHCPFENQCIYYKKNIKK
ncbi:MAG: endonuclease III [Bacilli bacterium]